jgi:hypothetical protein
MTTDNRQNARWLLLIHQIPPKPPYLRVKIWRRLQRLGAVAIKNSVYALPQSDQAREDFQWVLREIVEGGGDGTVCEARLLDGMNDNQVEALFVNARASDYKRIAEDARRFANTLATKRKAVTEESRPQLEADVARLKRRLDEVEAIDFLGAPGREAAAGLIGAIESRLRGKEPSFGREQATIPIENLRGKTWVTRRGIHVDRIASAWLIRRFIDAEARFKFVPAKGYKPVGNEIRFDMFEAEFTHVADRCTIEVLIERLGINDKAARAIAEIVHDIDLKDSKFEHPETPGIERLITGIAKSHRDDEMRLERGQAVFDDLYGAYHSRQDRNSAD